MFLIFFPPDVFINKIQSIAFGCVLHSKRATEAELKLILFKIASRSWGCADFSLPSVQFRERKKASVAGVIWMIGCEDYWSNFTGLCCRGDFFMFEKLKLWGGLIFRERRAKFEKCVLNWCRDKYTLGSKIAKKISENSWKCIEEKFWENLIYSFIIIHQIFNKSF